MPRLCPPLRRLAHVLPLLLLAAVPVPSALAGASGPPARFPLTAELILATLNGAGLHLTAPQVHVPMALNAAVEAPLLYIAAANIAPGGLVRLRLTCAGPGECLPFLATVEIPDAAERDAALALLRAGALASASGAPDLPALRIGARTTLLMESAHMRIALPVVALDAGRVGAEIRVTTPDRKQTFRGTVQSAAIVRGDLP